MAITSSGRVVFASEIKYTSVPFKPDTAQSVWASEPAQPLKLKAISNQPTGVAGTFFGGFAPIMDDTGQIGFLGNIGGGDSTVRSDEILGKITQADQISMLIREGATAPGSSMRFGLGPPSLSQHFFVNGGSMAVNWELVPPDATSGNTAAVYLRDNVLRVILAKGMPAPRDATRKVSFALVSALNANGQALVYYENLEISFAVWQFKIPMAPLSMWCPPWTRCPERTRNFRDSEAI